MTALYFEPIRKKILYFEKESPQNSNIYLEVCIKRRQTGENCYNVMLFAE